MFEQIPIFGPCSTILGKADGQGIILDMTMPSINLLCITNTYIFTSKTGKNKKWRHPIIDWVQIKKMFTKITHKGVITDWHFSLNYRTNKNVRDFDYIHFVFLFSPVAFVFRFFRSICSCFIWVINTVDWWNQLPCKL